MRMDDGRSGEGLARRMSESRMLMQDGVGNVGTVGIAWIVECCRVYRVGVVRQYCTRWNCWCTASWHANFFTDSWRTTRASSSSSRACVPSWLAHVQPVSQGHQLRAQAPKSLLKMHRFVRRRGICNENPKNRFLLFIHFYFYPFSYDYCGFEDRPGWIESKRIAMRTNFKFDTFRAHFRS